MAAAARLREIGHRAVRPPFFMENLLPLVPLLRDRGVLTLPVAADRPLPLCAVEDIAAAAVRLLLDRTWSGVDSVPLVSPDDLTPDGMAEVLAGVLGRPVRFERLALADYRSMLAGSGMSAAAVASLAEMAAAQDHDAYRYGPQPASRTATGFRPWCASNLGVARAA